MTSTWRHAAAALAADLRHVFASRLRSIVAYGPRIDGADDHAPLTCMALVESCGDCEALVKRPVVVEGGCSTSGRRPHPATAWLAVAALLVALYRLRS